MNKDAELKRKTGRMIAKNLIILFVLLVVAFVGAMSWFTQNNTTTADGINVECVAPDGVEIAIVKHGETVEPETLTYSTSVSLKSGEGVLEQLDLQELTSDGVTFKRPALTQQNGVASATNTSEWAIATPGKEYVSFDLYIRAKSQKRISLSSLSNFETVASRLTWSDGATVTDSDNASTYGNFSKDALVGATRVSVVGYDSETKTYVDKRLLWVTRPDMFLKKTGYNLELLTLASETDYGIYGTNQHYYREEGTLNLIEDEDAVASKDSNGSVKLGQNIPITSFNPVTDGATYKDGYWYVHVVYNTWIEGEDAEAKLALAGGKFKINLQLLAEKN